jgi:hypothetical protein
MHLRLVLSAQKRVCESYSRTRPCELSGSGLPLTPEGLESAITVEQTADLIAFLLTPQ